MPTTTRSRRTFATSVGVSSISAVGRLDGKVLGQHVEACRACSNRLFRIRRALDSLDTFAAPRFVTTLAAFVAVLALLGVLL